MLTFNLPRNLMSLVFLFLLFAADSRIKNRERRNLRCRKCQSQRWMGRNGRRTNTKSMYIHSSSPWFSPLCRWSFDTIKIEKPFYGKYKIENKHEPISVQLGVSLVPPSERASQTDRNGEAINFMVENFMRQLRCCDYTKKKTTAAAAHIVCRTRKRFSSGHRTKAEREMKTLKNEI